MLFLISLFVELNATLLKDDNFKSINLSYDALYYLEDNATLTYQEVKTDEYNALFIQNDKSSISPAYTDKTLWIKFSITNQSAKAIDTMLNLPIPWINNIECYISKADETLSHKMGIQYPFYERVFIAPDYTIPLTLSAEEKVETVLKVHGSQSLIIAPILHSKNSFEAHNSFIHTFNGAIAGILALVIFFSFILYMRVRDKIFLYYSFFTTALFLMLGSFYGYNFQLFWSNYPYINETMTTASISLYSFFGLLFTRYFLDTDRNMPKMGAIAKYLTYILFILFISNFIIQDKMLITNISVLLVFINSVLIILIAILAFRRKISGAKAFLFAWTLSNIASIITSLLVLGNIGYSDTLYQLTGVAHIVDLILFSQAIADRTLILRKENSALIDKNMELTDISNKDGLTGAYNRRYFDKFIQYMWDEKRGKKLPITLIMIDIDYFKFYNDTYGHQAGDDCLILVTEAMNSALYRSTDFIARYGGEEFVVLISGDIDVGEVISKRIITAVESLSLEHRRSPYGIVTVSLGVSSLIPNDKTSIKTLISNADKALYISKESGRNKQTKYEDG